MRRREEKLDRETLKKIAPQYIKDLEALGVDIEKLWDRELNAFVRKKNLINRVGKEEFKVIQTIGRTVRAGRWKEKYVTEPLRRDFLEIFGSEENFPNEIKKALSLQEIDSLTLHYLKRKYVNGWKLKNPEELDSLFVEHIKRPEVLIYKQGARFILELNRKIAVIEPPHWKITFYELEEEFSSYEELARSRGWDRFTIKLWQLKQKLRLL
ncbi:hypothetical protein [Hydrogenivirga sp. 128-5-R1-1]|uniref:hypothetical protein n=1 Tax=Hydrogenivirga sp. 128-5-R1-1 TaxID=392423 RepID=UPI0002F4916A|nr:hypothetical protein [Hydrogenivirga sp. 128-5-R1-1]